MSKNPRYRLVTIIKSTNKEEMIAELQYLVDHLKQPNTFGFSDNGISEGGSCDGITDLCVPNPSR